LIHVIRRGVEVRRGGYRIIDPNIVPESFRHAKVAHEEVGRTRVIGVDEFGTGYTNDRGVPKIFHYGTDVGISHFTQRVGLEDGTIQSEIQTSQ